MWKKNKFEIGDILVSKETGKYMLVTGFNSETDRYTFIRLSNGEAFSNPRFYVDRWTEKVA